MSSIIHKAKEIADRLELSPTRLYGLTGVSATTWRYVFVSGEEPVRPHCRDAIRRFVALNESARSISDLRVP